MATITIIGGHGKIALRLSRLLSARGHEIRSWIRSAAQENEVRAAGATPLILNVEPVGTNSFTTLLQGQDVVIWCAGAGGGNPQRTYAVDRDAAIRSIDAAQAAGVGRYLMVSYFGSRTDHGVPADQPFFHYAESKAAADAHLRASSLDWTILGPSRLTDQPGTGAIETGDGIEAGAVSRDDVAAVAAAALEHPGTIRTTIAFNNGPTPIADALA
ncbi:SDR family oxidoreductase [Pseudactinotalea sp. HY158]|uniref:SDR family oxidoreductase n=1 Tax=Pseudactinotalea sp. HY158 TaxID=2654547 RepID=UPI00129C3E66|nr:SDR family oxidoreductase [Pseudactinotalea sp. HY158]QGH70562.1 NAD(P)H-binding protein [Pseudactinotalea sp. HY158]